MCVLLHATRCLRTRLQLNEDKMVMQSRETVELSKGTREFCYKLLKCTSTKCMHMSSLNQAVPYVATYIRTLNT